MAKTMTAQAVKDDVLIEFWVRFAAWVNLKDFTNFYFQLYVWLRALSEVSCTRTKEIPHATVYTTQCIPLSCYSVLPAGLSEQEHGVLQATTGVVQVCRRHYQQV